MSEFIAVQKPDGTYCVKSLSTHHKQVISSLVETDSPAETSAIYNCPIEDIKNLINDPEIAQYVSDMRLRFAKASMVDTKRILSMVHDALFKVQKKLDAKDEELTRNDISILNMGCDVTGAKKTTIAVEVKNINPLDSLSDEELDKLVQDRVKYFAERNAKLLPAY